MPRAIEYFNVIIPHRGYIAPLKMFGPINHAIKITKDDVIAIITSGIQIHEYDVETKMVTPLTIQALTGIASNTKVEAPAKPVTPTVTEIPGVTNTPVKEDDIDWSSMSKSQRKRMRAQLEAQKTEAATVTEETLTEEPIVNETLDSNEQEVSE